MHRYAHFIGILIFSFLIAGCAVKVIPSPGGQGTINPADNSLTITNENVSIKVVSADTEISSYNLDDLVSAFSVTIQNLSDREVSFATDSFLLLDGENRQYFPLTPAMVKEITSRDSYYLIPYPYVGFYYLEDYEKVSAYNATSTTQIPYYYELYPHDIYTKALAAGSVIPKATATGLVYFRIDLRSTKSVKLLVYRQGSSKSSPPDFTFPFTITK